MVSVLLDLGGVLGLNAGSDWGYLPASDHMDWQTIFLIIGFSLAAYSVIGNDSLQTLGTFLASNAHRPWWVLWLFAAFILVVTMLWGWHVNGGDAAFGRLERFPYPDAGSNWIFIVPPLFLLFLTRYGIPVSTTFLVLTTFRPENLGSMLEKSLFGYAVAFASALLLTLYVTKQFEKRFLETAGEKIPGYWVLFQWAATALLWSAWLMQDVANVFIYLPRQLGLMELCLALGWIVVIMAWIFYIHGGKIQKIVLQKTNTTDIRSATIIDLVYALVLFIFKYMSDVPMSTTWVFLGLLAGREIGFTLNYKMQKMKKTYSYIGRDAVKALIGLGISIGLAVCLPLIHGLLSGKEEIPPSIIGTTGVYASPEEASGRAPVPGEIAD